MSIRSRLDRQLILASNSPRRKEILERLGFEFSVRAPRLDDEVGYVRADDLPGSLGELARAKALSIAEDTPSSLVLGGDTVVAWGECIMGKPRSRDEARYMLESLAGVEHEVVTGVALVCIDAGLRAQSFSRTRVWFRALSPEEIDWYLAMEEYADKAGAYAIQGSAMAFVERIEGCFYNVVGLPISATLGLFEEYRSRKEE
jgi:septum formation protein